MDNLSMRFILNDVNSIPDNQLVPKEILVDYDTGDFYFISLDGKKISCTKKVAELLENKLDIKHMKSTEEHACATTKTNGFMDKNDKKDLLRVTGFVDKIKDMNFINDKLYNEKLVDGILDNIKFKCFEDRIEIDEFNSIIDKRLVEVGKANIGIERPTKDFKNINGQVGFRNDLIYMIFKLKDKEEVIEVKCAKDIDFINNDLGINPYRPEFILYNNASERPDERLLFKKYENNVFRTGGGDKYSKFKLDSDDGYVYLIPLFRLKVLNNEYFSPDNINGKITDIINEKSEIISIYNKIFIDYINMDQLLLNSITDLENERLLTKDPAIGHINYYGLKPLKPTKNTIAYIPFNGDDNDKIKNVSLNKQISFTRSIFGKSMYRAKQKGYTIDLMSAIQNCFELDFTIMDSTVANEEELIEFQNIKNLPSLKISIKNLFGDKYLTITDCSSNQTIISYMLDIDEYQFIKLIYNNNQFELYANSHEPVFIKKMPFNLRSIYYASITNMNVPMAYVRINSNIEKDFCYSEDIINKRVTFNNSLINNKLSNGQLIEKHVINLDNIENDKIIEERATYGKWSKFDKITIIKDHNEVLYGKFTSPLAKIVSIDADGNYELDHAIDLDINAQIKILDNESNNIENSYIIEYNEFTKLKTNKPSNSNFIGYEIYSFEHQPNPIISDGNNKYKTTTIYDGSFVTIILQEDIPQNCTLEFISLIKDDNKIVQDPYYILGDNTMYKKKTELENLQNISLEYNGDIKPFVPYTTFINNEFEVNIHLDITNIKNIIQFIDDITMEISHFANYDVIVNNNENLRCKENAIQFKSIKIDDYRIDGNDLIIKLQALNNIDKTVLSIKDIKFDIKFENLYTSEDGKCIKLDENSIESSSVINSVKLITDICESPEIDINGPYVILTRPYIIDDIQYLLIQYNNNIKLLKIQNGVEYVYNIYNNPIFK